MGHESHPIFGQKLPNTQCGVGRYTHKSSMMKWANGLSLQKNSLKLNTASHNNTSWYIDTDGFLEHSPTRGSLSYKRSSLQKIILGFLGGPPLYISKNYNNKKDSFLMNKFNNKSTKMYTKKSLKHWEGRIKTQIGKHTVFLDKMTQCDYRFLYQEYADFPDLIFKFSIISINLKMRWVAKTKNSKVHIEK